MEEYLEKLRKMAEKDKTVTEKPPKQKDGDQITAK